MNAKENHNKSTLKKNKIAHIFNIRSINLIEKIKYDREKIEIEKQRLKNKYSSKEIKKSIEKDNLKGLNLILVEKKSENSPDAKRRGEKKNSVPYLQKVHTENKSLICVKTDNNFESRLGEYHQYIRDSCALHGLTMREVESYARNSLIFYVGRGNNCHLIK
jgi:hypothetical protein